MFKPKAHWVLRHPATFSVTPSAPLCFAPCSSPCPCTVWCGKQMRYHLLHPMPREVSLSLSLLIQALSKSPGPPAHPMHFWMLLEPLEGYKLAAPLCREGTNNTAVPGSKQHLGLPLSPQSHTRGKPHTRFPTKPSRLLMARPTAEDLHQ